MVASRPVLVAALGQQGLDTRAHFEGLRFGEVLLEQRVRLCADGRQFFRRLFPNIEVVFVQIGDELDDLLLFNASKSPVLKRSFRKAIASLSAAIKVRFAGADTRASRFARSSQNLPSCTAVGLLLIGVLPRTASVTTSRSAMDCPR